MLKRIFHFFKPRNSVGIPQSLRRVIDNYNTAAVLTTYNTVVPTVLHTNKLHKKLMGYSSDELVGKTPKAFQGKNTSEETKLDMRKSLLAASFWNGTVTNYRKDGSEVNVEIVIFPISYGVSKYYVALKKESK